MASTNPQDRLNRLFVNSPLLSTPTPGELHFSEKELQEKKAKDEEPWQVSASQQSKEPQRDLEILTSSDEDDYVAAFRKKPSMKPKSTQPKPRKMPEPNAFGYPKDSVIEPKGPIEYLAKGKWSKRTLQSGKATKQVDSDDDDERFPAADEVGNPVKGHFCQFNLAAKFPYKYMNDANDRVSRHFFASNKFYNRKWDLYYLHAPFSLSAKPIVLVPLEQVQQLITQIGQAFKVPVSVPKFPFTLTFFADGTPEPVFLGQSCSKDDAIKLQNTIPAAPLAHGECAEGASPKVKQAFADFKSKCQGAVLAKGKGKGAGGKKKREEDRLLTVKDWYVQLKRAQRCLGLRQKTGHVQYSDPGMSWEEQQEFHLKQLKKAHFVLDPLNVDQPAPFPFEKEPVIIAIDIESYERAHNLITEIGISTLDTLDLVGVAPGPNGKQWLDQIRSRHFRINGREHLVNKDFCIGHPDAYQFGKSEWIDLKEAVASVDSCFEWPFSVQFKHASIVDQWSVEPETLTSENNRPRRVSEAFGGVSIGPTNAEQDAASRAAIASVLDGIGNKAAIQQAVNLTKHNHADPETLQLGPKQRNVILVGHDLRTDVEYLRDLGSKIFSPSRATYPIAAMEILGNGDNAGQILLSIIDTMDTGPLYRVLKEEVQNRSLSSIMSDLGLPCFFPHNGGNDARYTLEAWVAMLIKARLQADQEQKKGEEDAENMAQLAKENDAWNQGSEWGGMPLGDPGQSAPSTPEQNMAKADLNSSEASIMATSPEVSPPHPEDDSIAALAKNLRLDPSIDHQESETRYY
ncbi:hypothetical protein H2200_006954 [Cladophialophora chaetospira]|uniref:Gfd2/YDR514C-like C-terminal domain-containing protein n=1 Tax=Cladophialophora chaetospira TaxID=386627 RepID=A0AA38X9S9_9EURO|nr:hypothetical protein H2200_006954 [Cladophialophora chaetospira]